MKAKPYIINRKQSVGSCIVKVKYDKCYIIIKCKNMYNSLKSLENGLNAVVRGGFNNKRGLYYFLFEHVMLNPNHKFVCEVLFESNKGYELLIKEHEILEESIRKDKTACLNTNTTPYIPDWDGDAKMYNWITKADVLNYKNWLTKHNNK